MTAFGQRISIINSFDIAVSLLGKKGSIYSDRPPLSGPAVLAGIDAVLPVMPTGDRHTRQRGIIHKVMGTKAEIQKFCGLQEDEAQRCLQNILDDPESFVHHIRL